MSIVVAYAPTEDASKTGKDSVYNQLESLLLSMPRQDQLFVLGDLNAIRGTDCLGYEAIIGSHGSSVPNDNTHLLNLCSMAKLVITGSFFMRLDICRHTWISHDGHTRKKGDHILTRDISLITW